jgi:hypothetical protein
LPLGAGRWGINGLYNLDVVKGSISNRPPAAAILTFRSWSDFKSDQAEVFKISRIQPNSFQDVGLLVPDPLSA